MTCPRIWMGNLLVFKINDFPLRHDLLKKKQNKQTKKACPSSPLLSLSVPASEWWHGDDNMSHWHRSVDELVVWHRQQKECERAQEALSRVTSCFQQLVTSLGSSADSNFLREELDETRRVAHQLCIGTDSCPSARLTYLSACNPHLCAGLSQRLVQLLSESESASSGLEDRRKLERLWVLFLSAVESFLSDLRTAYSLIADFPLIQPKDRSSLLNTGQQMF